MLNLLVQYLKKTQKVWVIALVDTLLAIGILSLLLLIPGLLYIFTIFLGFDIPYRLLQMLGFEAIAKALIIPLFVVSLIYMPALALTATTVIGVAAIYPILAFFTLFDAIALEVVGIVFSLKKLLLNPIGRLQTLRPILEGQTLNCASYLNLVNDITSPNAEGYCESLGLSEDQEAELVRRQIQATTELPANFKALRAKIEARDWGGSDLDATIAGKKSAYQEYRARLSDAQKACLDAYLDSTLELTHAICCVSREPLSPENQDQFIMLEKRYKEGENWHAVPCATKFFYLDPNVPDLFLNLAQYNKDLKRWTITHPLNRDPLFDPLEYGASQHTTQYRQYKYQVIGDHPLSLQVCEAIEDFNVSMQSIHEDTSNVVKQDNSATNLSSNHCTDPIRLSSDRNSIYNNNQSRQDTMNHPGAGPDNDLVFSI